MMFRSKGLGESYWEVAESGGGYGNQSEGQVALEETEGRGWDEIEELEVKGWACR